MSGTPSDPQSSDPTASAAGRRRVLQDAFEAIERLQARLDATRREPIAIVGLGCRIPGGVSDAQSYWSLLQEGRDAVGQIPPDRWDVDAYYDPDPSVPGKVSTKAGGFLKDIELFEPAFFGMSPREAVAVDPQQRLLLEVAWEALENAAIPADQLDGSLTGVFVGITSTDYGQRVDVADPARSDMYLATGSALNAAAGRISFTFGLQGPCMAIDTACSSSLVAIHTACQSLRARESNLAIAGGVNAILSPDPFVLIGKWGMLAPDGRCKTFDASANGFVRAEGCGLIVLERLSDAIANGRRILAVIRGSAINQDGHSSGLTVPNGLAQQAVVRQALAAANLAPTDVSYVEAHGTGTSLGDPIEVEALAAVYGQGRSQADPLELGSVKSNVGHLEAAAGVTGLIKVVLSMQHGQIPASLHVTQPTPAIPWDRLPLRVSTKLHDWQPRGGTRRAGVSAFGFSGMNAHVILEEPAPATPAPAAARPTHLLLLSAKSRPALAAMAAGLADHLAAHPDLPLADVCATMARGRSHFGHRLALLAPDTAAMTARLRAAAADESEGLRGHASAGSRLRVAFLFTGQGSQYVGMGRDLDASEPVFRATIDRCAAVLDPLLPRPLRELLFSDPDGQLDQTGCTQPALFAIEVALAALWQSWGVEPSVVVGHSIGEFAGAVVAGVLTLEDGARLVAARGRLMQALPAGGLMVALQGDVAVIEREVAAAGGQVSIAARNAPGNVVVAGAHAPVTALATRLAAAGLKVRPLPVSHAFHSPLMDPMLAEFRAVAATVEHTAPKLTWISTQSGVAFDWSTWGDRMADYWCRQARASVAFQAAIESLAGTDVNVCIEIGPDGTLTGLGQQCAGNRTDIAWIASVSRKRLAAEQLAEGQARLYVRGARFAWSALGSAAGCHSVPLPTYPFQRQRYILEPRKPGRRAGGPPVHALLGARLNVAGVAGQFERVVGAADPAWMADHRIGGSVLMPLTAYLETMLAAAQQVRGSAATGLDQVEMAEPLALADEQERLVQVVVDRDGGRIRVYSRDAATDDGAWTLHASAVAAETGSPTLAASRGASERCPRVIAVDPFYETLRSMGANFGPSFRSMRTAMAGSAEAVGEIDWPDSLRADQGRYHFHPALLDACFHVAAVAIDSLPAADDGRRYLPIGVDRYRWFGAPSARLRCHAAVRAPQAHGDLLMVDLRIDDADTGAPVAEVLGLRCRRVGQDIFRHAADAQAADCFYAVRWEEQPIPADRAVGGHWLLFDDGKGRGERLAVEIERRGGTARRVVPGTGYVAHADTTEIDPAAPDHLERLLADAAADGVAGVVSLWPLRVPALREDDLPSGNQQFGTDAALRLVQALVPAPVPLWFVTAGTEDVDGTEIPGLEQAPVAGLARVAALEHPELRVVHVDLDPAAPAADVRAIADELSGAVHRADPVEHRVAWRKGARHVARLARQPRPTARPVDAAPVRLIVTNPGTLDSVTISPMQRRAPAPGEVEIRVRASGLNFRDVLLALGLYPGAVPHLGSDCAGEIVALGAEVPGFRIGDRVVAMTEGAFASHTTTRWEFVAPLPEGLDFDQGAAVPTAYLTAAITLVQIARIGPGDRVLIHAGAGGVGMAAIALARRAGAEIFATAGSPDKRAVLAALGVHHVLDSRSPGFADQVLRITGGAGVNVVLNSLTGAMRDRSFEILAPRGVFLEIGKRDLWTDAQVAALGREIRYHVVDCSDNARETPLLVGETLRAILRDIGTGALPRLPVTTFRFDRAPDAFRYMAQARHIGRVVFRHPVVPARVEQPVRGDATYVITGGTRGIGLAAARWLADQGATHLLLAARTEPDPEARAALASLGERGVSVRCVAADLGTAAGVETLMDALAAGPAPLGGLLHGAARLDDAPLLHQTPTRFAAVMAPKADGAWLLHRALLRRGLAPDFLVLHSSMSTVFGSPGQANYVAANSFLEALARHRVAHDLPATSIAWGAWQDIGMAARGGVADRAGRQGFEPLAPALGLHAMGVLLRDGVGSAAVAPIEWSRVARHLGNDAPPPFLRDLLLPAQRQSSGTDLPAGPVDFAAMPAAERLERIRAVVRRQLAAVLGLPDHGASVAGDDSFSSLGLDSLGSVELRNRLHQALGRAIGATAAFEWPTIDQLASHLAGQWTDPVDAAREEVTL